MRPVLPPINHVYTLERWKGKISERTSKQRCFIVKLNVDNMVTKEFMTIPNEAGDQMNAYIIKPKILTQIKNIHYLCFNILKVLNQVSNSWDGGNGLWFNHLVQKGTL